MRLPLTGEYDISCLLMETPTHSSRRPTRKEIMSMALLIPADSTQPTRLVQPENGRDFQLPQLRTLLSCDMIEICRLSDPSLMLVIDDEGKLVGKPRNARATALMGFAPLSHVVADLLAYRTAGIEVIFLGEPLTDLTSEVDWIAGDVLLCRDEEIR